KKNRGSSLRRGGSGSATQAELLDQRLVAGDILAVQVVEQAAAAVDHLQQAAAAVVVLLVELEVLGEMHDACGQQGDLDFRRTGVVLAALVVFDDGAGVDGHRSIPCGDAWTAETPRACRHRCAPREPPLAVGPAPGQAPDLLWKSRGIVTRSGRAEQPSGPVQPAIAPGPGCAQAQLNSRRGRRPP